MSTLIIFVGIIAAQPVLIAPQSSLGIVTDGEFEALLTLTPLDYKSGEGEGAIEATVKVTLEGRKGTHLVRNPFFDERIACTSHIIVYDDTLTLVGLFPLNRRVDSTPSDRVKDRIMLTPGLVFGRTISLSIPRRMGVSKQPLYAQAVMLKSLLNGYGTIEPINSSSVASYQASIRDNVAGVSSGMELHQRLPEGRPTEVSSPNLAIAWRHSTPGADRLKFGARLTNNSDEDIYAPLDLFLPVAGWLGGPTLIAEGLDGARFTVGDARRYGPQRTTQVLRMPPHSFIECEHSITTKIPWEDSIAPSHKDPLSIRLVDVLVLQRRAPTTDSSLIVSRPSADSFSRLRVAPSNPLPLFEGTR